MRWRLILEEFGPELKYIKGENNVVADALSRLEKSPNQEILNISELYYNDDKDLSDSANPIYYHDISKAQVPDAKLQQKLDSHKDDVRDVNHIPYLRYKISWWDLKDSVMKPHLI